MKKLPYLLALVLSCPVQPAWADPTPLVAVPDGPDKISPLREGEKAPFTGQLFDNSTALRWGNWLEQYRVRLPAQHAEDKAVCLAEREYDQARLDHAGEKYALVTATYQKRVAELETEVLSPPFYKTFWFGMAAGGLTVGLSVTSVFLIFKK